MESEASRRSGLARLLGPGLVLPLVALLYLPTLGYPFVALDDPYGVVTNPAIRDLSWEGIRFFFVEDQRDFRYFPLTYLSFAVDHALFGLNPAGFHGVNVLFHLANTLLVFVLIRKLHSDPLVAGIGSLLFGIHPLQVESVAWVMSRKNVLFLFFFLLSILAYLPYAREGSSRGVRASLALGGSVLLFLLSMTAKSAAAGLPAVLVLIDHHLRPEPPRRLFVFLARSLPSKLLYLPAIVFSWAMTRRLEGRNPFFAEFSFDAWSWAVIIAHNLFFYVAKAIAPLRLGVFYPLPVGEEGLLPLRFYAFAILALVLIGLVVWSRRTRPHLFLGGAWYLVTILPLAALPLVFHDLPLLAADRYFYQSGIGLFFLASAGFAALWRRPWGGAARAGVAAALACVLGLLFVASWQQRQVWRGTVPLYEQTVRHHPSNAFYYRLAIEYSLQGRMAAAFQALEDADHAPRQIFFGRVFSYQLRLSDLYRRKGDFRRAAAFLESGLESTPNALEPVSAESPLAYHHLAHLYERAGDYESAVEARKRAHESEAVGEGYFESVWLAVAPDEAGRFLERRVREQPGDAAAWYYLGRWHESRGRAEEARGALRRAAELGFDPAQETGSAAEGPARLPAPSRAGSGGG